jgi:hypothetical protein
MGASISAPPQIRARIKMGTYVGDGTDNRNINIGINLAAKSNAWVIIKNSLGFDATHRIEYDQGDLAMFFSSSADYANLIQSFTSTGFQVGTHNSVNTNGSLYRYIVFYEE